MNQDRYTWTASLGRWLGVPIRLHVLFVLFAIVIYLIEWHIVGRSPEIAATAIVTVIVLLVSVLLHELAHCFVNVNLGGQIEDITLAPWGGQSRMLVPSSHKAQLLIHLAGPFASGIIFAIGAILLVQSGNAQLGDLVNPLRPIEMGDTIPEIAILKIATWVNFQLFVINLLPVHPLDGSYILRSATFSQNPELSRLRAETIVLVVGIGTSLCIVAMAWVFRDQSIARLFPGWFIFSMFGITLISTARYGFHVYTLPLEDDWHSDSDEFPTYNHLYEDDDVMDFDGQEGDQLSISQWLQEKQESRETLEREIETEEEQRADKILAKLHSEGIDKLTDEEKSLLNRVSARYRRRRHTNS